LLKRNKKLLIAIPVYNEENYLKLFLEKLIFAVDGHLNYDIVVFDDCSSDDSAQMVKDYDNIKYIKNPINLGYGKNLNKIFNYSFKNEYNYLILIDGDGEHDPQNINRLINKYLDTKANIVIGSRFELSHPRYNMGIFRRLGKYIFQYFIYIKYNKHINDPTSGNIFFNDLAINFAAKIEEKYIGNYYNLLLLSHQLDNNMQIEEEDCVFYKSDSISMHPSILQGLFFVIKQLFLSFKIIGQK
jgi:glycosyltransferase involved in cell wall biosynthesis